MKFLARDMVDILFSGYLFSQKTNYLKYLLAESREVLRYDPVTISMVATGRCTLSCDMCPTHSDVVPKDYEYIQNAADDMSFGMFKEIVDRFRNAVNVHIIGSGEPLLNRDFFRMVDYAASLRMKVKTFSNGTTVDENIGDLLNSRLNGITISLNGHDAKEFNRMTGMEEAIYEKIYSAAGRLVEERNRRRSKLRIKLSFIIDKHNYRFVPDMAETALKLGADHVFFCNFLPSPYEGLSAEERLLTADKETAGELKTIFGSYPAAIRKKITPPVLVDAGTNINRCRTHFSQIRFDGDGNVSSCSMMLLNMIGRGNYRDKDIWNNEFFRKMRRMFLLNDPQVLPQPCRSCPDNKGVCL